MRDRLFVLAMVLLIVAILLFGVTIVLGVQVTTTTVPAGSALKVRPSTLTSETIRVNWTDAPRGTHVYLITGNAVCTTPTGVVGTGNGTAGSFSVSVDPGRTYLLYACGGTSYRTANLSFSASGGISVLELLGGLSLVAGLVLLILSLRPDYRGEVDEAGRPTSRARKSVAAALGAAMRLKREALARPGQPSSRQWSRTVQACPECGRIYTYRLHATCPACGAVL